MIKLEFLDLTKKRFPDLRFSDHKDIIKLEKILKAEAKLDSGIQINDIEILISFLKSYGNKFTLFFEDENISAIVKGEERFLTFIEFNTEVIPDETFIEFQQIFEANIHAYLKSCVRNSEWNNLRITFTNYYFLVSHTIREDIFQALQVKNQAILHAIQSGQYIDFVQKNEYAIQTGYFSMLSSIDEYSFEEDIQNINNIIAEAKRKTKKETACLGKILYALTYYDAYSENLEQTLSNNQSIAYGWIFPKDKSGGIQWTTKNIVTTAFTILVLVGIIIAIPGSPGAAIGLTIFIVRLIIALWKSNK